MTALYVSLKKLYEKDENLWLFQNAELIRSGQIDEADWENIAEELESMGKSQYREVLSRMVELILHLLKWVFQKEYRGSSWEVSIKKQRWELRQIFEDSQNLKNYAVEQFETAYGRATDLASSETGISKKDFPKQSPFTLDQAVSEEYWPD